MNQRYFSKSHLSFVQELKSAWIVSIYGKSDFGIFCPRGFLVSMKNQLFELLGISKNPLTPSKYRFPPLHPHWWSCRLHWWSRSLHCWSHSRHPRRCLRLQPQYVGIGILRGLGDSWKSLKFKNGFSINTNNPRGPNKI